MLTVLYTVIIYPLEMLIELCYLMAYRICHNFAFALVAVSFVVSLLTLPLYFIAEKSQHSEREKQKKMRPRMQKIREAFSGDERYMILSAYYRQNHYHPVYAMRNTFSLLIQIPFFIAAYHFISHLGVLQNTSFFFLSNLAEPDKLLKIGTLSINVLPIIMTLINGISGFVYTKKLPFGEKAQVFGTSLIFLLLLYDSPSSLVLYWTCNNLFSLAKNILQKIKRAKVFVYILCCCAALFVGVYVLFFHHGALLKRLLVAAVMLIFAVAPVLRKYILSLKHKPDGMNRAPLLPVPSIKLAENFQKSTNLFYLALCGLFLLCGVLLPTSLAASSVEEFSFIENYDTPYLFLINTALQAAGFFLFWPLCIFFLAPQKVKALFTKIAVIVLVCALINNFFFNRNYGWLTPSLIFSDPAEVGIKAASDQILFFTNIVVLVIGALALIRILHSKHCFVFIPLQIVFCLSLFSFSFYNLANIKKSYAQVVTEKDQNEAGKSRSEVFSLSKTGKNVLFIMLDGAISDYVPYIMEERPDLKDAFSGFTYYPNCVSLAGRTFLAAPALFGGYEYSPEAMNERRSERLADKYIESYRLLPNLFSQAGYQVTAANLPTYESRYLYKQKKIALHSDDPNITVTNVMELYAGQWLKEHPEVGLYSIKSLLLDRMIRYSFFKIAPAILRMFIYDNGEWLTTLILDDDIKQGTMGALTMDTIQCYSILDFLPRLTGINDEERGSFVIFVNDLTHEPAFFDAPDYTPVSEVNNYGEGPFAREVFYHANIASYLLLAKWFAYLKQNDVYDNTRIIIVSDHGVGVKTPQAHILPNGSDSSAYHPVLLVKDFGRQGEGVLLDDRFMTNADAPLLALQGIIDNPVNPYTSRPLRPEKEGGVKIATVRREANEYTYNIEDTEWLSVRDNVFDPSNWSKAQP
jgi:YidC/Oxa1 family membrane protein insertase